MRAFKLDSKTIALHSDDIKCLKVGEVFSITLKGVTYDLVLYSVIDKQYSKHTFKHYTVICISHEDIDVTEYLDI